MNPFNFGGIIKPQDPRDYDLQKINQSILGGTTSQTRTNNDYSHIPIDMQGKQPACGAHAVSRLKNILSLRKGQNRLHSSPRFNWKNIKDIDNYPIDSGTDINSAFKAPRLKGICSFDLAGNDVTLDEVTYRNLQITPEMTADALQNQTDAEAFIYNPTFEQLCDTIDVHGAAVILMRVGRNMYMNKQGLGDWSEVGILPLSPTNYPMDSAHFVCIENYDKSIGRIYFANEWSTAWGANGYGYFDQDYMPYVVAVGTCVDKELITPEVIPAPIVVNGQVTNWYQRFIALLKNVGLYKG